MNLKGGAEFLPDIILAQIRVQTHLTIFTGQLAQVNLQLQRILVQTIVQTGLDKLVALDYGDCLTWPRTGL